jgi:serine protease AprX
MSTSLHSMMDRRVLLVLVAAVAMGGGVRAWHDGSPARSATDGAPDRRSPEARRALAAEPSRTLPLWVWFDSVAAAGTGTPALSMAAIERRRAAGVPIFDTDLPLPAKLVARVEAAGGRVRHRSRWLRAVSVTADSAAAERIARLPGVRGVTRVGVLEIAAHAAGRSAAAEPARPADSAARQDSASYGASWSWLSQVGIPRAHGNGLTGRGVRIAILDTGFDTGHASFSGTEIVATRDFIDGGTDVRNRPLDRSDQARHGTWVWSLLASRVPGTYIGAAPGASYALAKVNAEPGDTRADEDRWVAAFEWADSLGARIINSSVGYRYAFVDRGAFPYSFMDGRTTVTSVVASSAIRRGILVVAMVGNSGPETGTLWAPADGDSIIAVGAVDAAGNPLPFSSRGPTADGRIKPELAARGTSMSAAAAGTEAWYDALPPGTSFATPLVAGAAALVMEAWPALRAGEVRRALLLSGNRARAPDNVTGWGVPSAAGAVLFPAGLLPVTVATVDVEGRSTTVTPTFTWSAPLVFAAERPVRYTVEIASDSAFTRIVHVDTVSDAQTLRVRRALPPRTDLWWRVNAQGVSGTRYVSPPGPRFSVPAWVRLETFANEGAHFTTSARPRLAWSSLAVSPPAGPFLFDVEVFRHADMRVVRTFRGLEATSVVVEPQLDHNVGYRWRVIARSPGGLADTVASTAPFVVTSAERPPATLLYQNFPNPFPRADAGHTFTRIWFDLSERASVELAVYDLRGRLVRRLIPALPSCGAMMLEPGQYGREPVDAVHGAGSSCVLAFWDGRDDQDRRMPGGVYVLRLRANGFEQVRRIVFRP